MPGGPLRPFVSTWRGCRTGSVGPSLRASKVGVSMGRKDFSLLEESFGFIYVCEDWTWSGLKFS